MFFEGAGSQPVVGGGSLKLVFQFTGKRTIGLAARAMLGGGGEKSRFLGGGTIIHWTNCKVETEPERLWGSAASIMSLAARGSGFALCLAGSVPAAQPECCTPPPRVASWRPAHQRLVSFAPFILLRLQETTRAGPDAAQPPGQRRVPHRAKAPRGLREPGRGGAGLWVEARPRRQTQAALRESRRTHPAPGGPRRTAAAWPQRAAALAARPPRAPHAERGNATRATRPAPSAGSRSCTTASGTTPPSLLALVLRGRRSAHAGGAAAVTARGGAWQRWGRTKAALVRPGRSSVRGGLRAPHGCTAPRLDGLSGCEAGEGLMSWFGGCVSGSFWQRLGLRVSRAREAACGTCVRPWRSGHRAQAAQEEAG